MDKNVICTIVTGNYGHYALALHDSLLDQNPKLNFAIFITQGEFTQNVTSELNKRRNLEVYTEQDFKSSKIANQLKEKYCSSYHDAYRWGMKPILLIKLLSSGYRKAIYVDSDIYFYDDFSFLFERLENYNLLLSPHWRSSNPSVENSNFKLNFLDGIYNGGFIGASIGGESALIYWAQLCLHKCEANRSEGYYVDQRYLDILPTRFESVAHIKHKGCNVANWNQVDCKRTLQPNNTVLINDTYPIIFIHFTSSMLRGVLLKGDSLLLSHLELYRDNLLKYHGIDIIKNFIDNADNLTSRKDVTKSNVSNYKKSLISRLLRKIKS